MPDSSSTLAETLSPTYRIERELGHGGMAVVYLAHDVKHDRRVALKVIRADLAIPGAAERFTREIRLAAGLQHPHILPVHDSGETGGQLWYTMPYVAGESLRDRLNREPRLPISDAVRIAREAAQALEHAHQHGVIHRDIKPENLLLTADGSVLVADFGIARALAGSGTEPAAIGTAARLTEAGLAIGTPAYMAPEQATGEHPVDGRADLYALGVVLYEMLCGEIPFSGSTPLAIVARSLSATPPPLAQRRPDIPPGLEALVGTTMAKNPADRFATAQALATALNQVLAAPGLPSRRPSSRTRRGFIALGVLGVVLLSFMLWRLLRGTGSPPEIQLAVLPFENQGAAEDAYFADGIADELRGKLAGLTAFQVTARASSDQYRGTSKSSREIGRELGVSYLLSATVRWAKAVDGTSRVQVMPELVRAETGAIAWQQPFEADLTDIFEVQARIAAQVAGALGAVLGVGDQQRLAERPTTNLKAYDLFLRASAETGTSQANNRNRVALLEQAVTLDSTFSRAWASLSLALGSLYGNGAPDPVTAQRALDAAERAIRLNPVEPAGYNALASYHYMVTRDLARMEEPVQQGLHLAPYDPALLSTAARIARQAGQFDVALADLQRSRRLNPRSLGTLNLLQTTLLWLRRYPEALGLSDSLLARRPGDLTFTQDKTMAYLGQGNLERARALIAGLSPEHPDSEVAAFFSYYWDMYWVLNDPQQRRVLELSPASFDHDRSAWATTLMELSWLRGDTVRARAYADTSYKENLKLLKEAPNDAQRAVLVGLALAYLGRKDEAIEQGLRGMALSPLESDKINGPYYQHQVARIYLLVGEPEKALDLLEPLLRTPYYLSPGWLRVDPTFASFTGNPRYDRLLAGK